MHGHHYTVEVVGTFNHEDADELWIGDMLPEYDGENLNDVFALTTVEEFAARLLSRFAANIEGVRQVTVWEDDDRWGRATR